MDKIATLHPVQTKILLFLLFKQESNFGKINSKRISTDLFTFHIKRLIRLKLVNKVGVGVYALTPTGKEYANKIDKKTLTPTKQAKTTVLVVASKYHKEKQKFLFQKRSKQPFYGFYGFITGKIKWGETVINAASRIFKEETGLTASFEYKGTEHKIDITSDNITLEDKFFYIVQASNIEGRLRSSAKGTCTWMSTHEVLLRKLSFKDIPKIIEYINKSNMFFLEDVYKYNISEY